MLQDSQDSLASSQYDDFVQDPTLDGLYFKYVHILSNLHLQLINMFDFSSEFLVSIAGSKNA